MNDMIQQIILKNGEDLEKRKQDVSLTFLKKNVERLAKPREFYQALQHGYKKHGVGLITEIKLASPTQTHLGDASDVEKRVKEYEQAGTDTISFVTEKYFFHGDAPLIKKIKNTVLIPVLQKDFIVDPYQIYEARISGADALLLIVKVLDKKKLQEFVQTCFHLGMEPVVEISDEEDLAKARTTSTRVIAVNARDLDTFVVDVDRASVLLKKIPDTFFKLGFSGIKSFQEVKKYKEAGAKGVLVGTSLMKAKNIGAFIKGLSS